MEKIRWIDDLLFCSALRSTARRAAFLLRAATSKALVAESSGLGLWAETAGR
jgi:hypothetical protein